MWWRKAAGVAAILLCGAAVGTALVLLGGFVYQAVSGRLAGGMVARAVGLLVVAVALTGVFGATLPDEGEDKADDRVQDVEPDHDAGADVDAGPSLTKETASAPAGAASKDEEGWFVVLIVVVTVLGLVVGGACGIAWYETLRPAAATHPEAKAPAPGAGRGEIAPERGGVPLSIYPELIPTTGGHVVVNHISMEAEPAVFALR